MDAEWLLYKLLFWRETELLVTNGARTLAINYRRIHFRCLGDGLVGLAFVTEERGVEVESSEHT